jgi:hypothetical protein
MTHFNTKEMAIAFHEIALSMAWFEEMNPNSSWLLKENRGTDNTLAC